MMVQKKKALSLVMCFMAVGLIASLISGCAGGGGGVGEKPQYGGELTVVAVEPVGWDDAIVYHYQTTGPYECLWSGDWSKGNAGGYGTKECDWILPGPINRMNSKTGYIADSWDIGDDYITFHLRDGVKWENRPPTNGRSVTADDVVFSLERQRTLDTAYIKTSYPALAAAMNISKVDEHTVHIDCPAQHMAELLSMIDFMYIYPEDVIETYGDMNDWTRAIGTGPFYVKEYVPGTSIYFEERRDDYWETYPVIGSPNDGDQLPYLDGVRVLIQPDASTQDSLFKTGQVDIIDVEYDRAQPLIAECPDAQYVKYFSDEAVICMRTDKADLPYKDVRVRQALMLGIDHQKMVDEMYGGEGEILYWPLAYCKEYAGAYLALEDYPASVQELFGHDVDKAKQLLEEAGYPDGFQAEIVVWYYYIYVDQLQTVKDMWAEIGVDLTTKPVDYNTWFTTQMMRNYDDMIYAGMAGAGTYFKGTNWYGTSMWNGSYIDDEALNNYRDQMLAAYPDEEECDSIHRQMLPYLQEQCYVLQTAAPYTYRFWWPWVKNYNGEGSLSYYKSINNGFGGLTQYLWIDQELKEQMGHGD